VAAGVEADGLDADPDMLEACRARIEGLGGRARLVRADMRDFTMPRRYNLIYVAFNSFLHNMTRDDQLATLRTCREHLEGDGVLALCMFVPDPAKLLEFDGSERPHDAFTHDGVSVGIWDTNVADPVAQTTHSRRRVEIRRDDAAFEQA